MEKIKKEIKYELDEIPLYLPIKLKKKGTENSQYKLYINQIPINFPYKPYPNQIKYMEKVIEALNSGQYAALESPTGSGKTLCLLTSVLSWVRINQRKNKFKGKIIYATRTHSQINNIIKELKKTNYDPITSIICSRDKFCIHDDLKKSYKNNQLNEMCRICKNEFKKIDHLQIINLKNVIVNQIEEMQKINFDNKNIDLDVQLSEFKENIEKYIKKIYMYEIDDITSNLNKLKELININKKIPNNYIITEELKRLNERIININNNNNLSCEYYNKTKEIPKIYFNDLDIESIYKLGKESNFCPFYYNIKKAKITANLIILPYQYILNPYIRYSFKFDIHDSIIILDEGHNIIDVLEDVSCNSINYKNCQDIQNLFQTIIDSSNEEINEFDQNYLFQSYNLVINIMKHLGQKIINTQIPKRGSQEIKVKNTLFLNIEDFKDFFYIPYDNTIVEKYKNDSEENFSKYMIDIKNKLIIFLQNFLLQKKKKCFDYLRIFRKNNKDEKKLYDYLIEHKNDLNSLDEMINFLKNFQEYNNTTENEEKSSFFFILKCNDYNKRQLKIQCISPLKKFNSLKDFDLRTLILTSGTLTPINFYESQLKKPFPIQLENSNLIHPSHIKFDLICNYLYNNFDLRYRELKNQEEKKNNEIMIYNIGKIVLNLIKNVNKGGVLIFFSSYDKMNKFYVNWLNNKIISEIEKYKKVNIDSKKLRKTIENFKEDLNSVLFTVSKGINSEGIDFTDDYGRMVICIGIPFADISDPKIYMKKKYLNDKYKDYYNNSLNKFINNPPLSGNMWYALEAIKTTNQCLGRIIRHIYDYGCLICIDSRFKEYINYFSDWLKNICSIKCFYNEFDFQNYLDDINQFYYQMTNEENVKLDLINYNILGQKRERNDDDDDFDLFNQVKCPICFIDNLKILYRSKCDHIICINCWNCILKNNNKCPICRRNVLKTDLIKEEDFFFNNS